MKVSWIALAFALAAAPAAVGVYAGYFRDLDGNKLNVFCMG